MTKGAQFELDVGEVLKVLAGRHPASADFQTQPRIVLGNGETVIPDFSFWFGLPYACSHYMVECQDRARYKAEVSHKIRVIKSLSRINKFIFVSSDRPAEAILRRLDGDGVLSMIWQEFRTFIARIDQTLSLLRAVEASTLSEEILTAYSLSPSKVAAARPLRECRRPFDPRVDPVAC